MTGFTIAEAHPADLADWAAMRSALWPGADPGELADELPEFLPPSSTQRGWIARGEGGAAVGFAEAQIRSYTEGCVGPTPYVEGLFVAPAWRRRGVARALLAAIETWAHALGHDELASDAIINNAESHSWHAAAGFAEVERIVLFRKALAGRA